VDAWRADGKAIGQRADANRESEHRARDVRHDTLVAGCETDPNGCRPHPGPPLPVLAHRARDTSQGDRSPG